ncbi:MAG: ankyrin repeat domain-containing protein [Alphaproteobacteria bacterium]
MKKYFCLIFTAIFICNTVFADASFLTLIKDGSFKEIKEAIKNGADVNDTSPNGVTALMVAAQYNPSVEVVELLIEKGAKVNARNSVGATVLMAALGNYNIDVLKAILKTDIDVNAVGKFNVTALMLAARSTRDGLSLKLLIEAGADTIVKDDNGYTALDYAKNNPSISNSPIILQLKNVF